MLAANGRFVLVGSQGCGKTTTARWLAIIAAMDGDEGRDKREQFGLPPQPLRSLFVRFRRFADWLLGSNMKSISGRVGMVSHFLSAEFEVGVGTHVLTESQALNVAQALLESDETLLIFDALDEVADPAMRRKLLDAVADLLEQYDQPRVVLTSRPYALAENDLKVKLPRFSPLPLHRTNRERFCHQWYQSVRVHLQDTLTQADADQRAADLVQQVERVPDLAETPLLLSTLALVHFNEQGLPAGRATLYEHATFAMLGHWRQTNRKIAMR